MSQNALNWIHIYEKTARNPKKWLLMASGFIKAAKKLMDTPPEYDESTFRIYMLLNAYAIEDAIKCILIVKDPNLVENGELKEIAHHGLKSLFLQTGISYSDINGDSEDLLDRLEKYIHVFGRYPVHKKWDKHKNLFSIEDDEYYHFKLFKQEDITTIRTIIKKLQEELKKYDIDWNVEE